MAHDKSSDWTTQEVIEQLRGQAKEGQPVGAQIFLHGDVAVDDIAKVVRDIVAAAKKEVGSKASTVEIGKIHRLAKSFSLTADVDTLAAVANSSAVKTILPSQVTDIFPRPVKVNPA